MNALQYYVGRTQMIPETSNWRPIAVEEIQSQLGSFRNWCLCGGKSLDWLIGRTTRPHGDTDIGLFRSNLGECLEQVGIGRVFLCHPPGSFMPWNGGVVPEAVHDIWILDHTASHWILQIMVYDDEGDQVVYRRDTRIRWSKNSHSILVRGIPIVNPVVSTLFKLNKGKLEDKDCRDVQVLIDELANYT